MKASVVVATLAACSPKHSLVLDLGVTGDPDRLPAGFACERSDGTLMMTEAVIGDTRLVITLVVDFLDMDGGLPLCRGDAIANWCSDNGGCHPLEVVGGARFCTELDIPVNFDDLVGTARAFNGALAGKVVIDDAPDRSVMVRIVATKQPCSEVAPWTGTSYPAYDSGQALGCEYSCPVFLDDVDRLTLSLDTFDQHCEAQVLACAAGP